MTAHAQPQTLTDFYQHLSLEQAPPIAFVKSWDRWVVNIDNAVDAFPDYEEFRAEFSHELTIDEGQNQITIVDPGTGGGQTEWSFTLLETADGRRVGVVTKTVREPEAIDAQIWFGQWKSNGFETYVGMLGLGQEDFFEPGAEAVLDAHPLISLEYALSDNGTLLTVTSSVNQDYAAQAGKIAASNISEDQVYQICEVAWPRYSTASIVLEFDPEKAFFNEKNRISL